MPTLQIFLQREASYSNFLIDILLIQRSLSVVAVVVVVVVATVIVFVAFDFFSIVCKFVGNEFPKEGISKTTVNLINS